MVRKNQGIEVLVNLINISYCAMKILPYQDTKFSEYQNKSVQEFRFALSKQIREQIFYAHFVETIENSIKSSWFTKALKQLIQRQGIIFKSCKQVFMKNKTVQYYIGRKLPFKKWEFFSALEKFGFFKLFVFGKMIGL